MLPNIMDEEWETMIGGDYGWAYDDMRVVFDKKVDEGFDIAGVEKTNDRHEYLVRIVINHVKFTRNAAAVEEGLEMGKLEVYSLSDKARLLERGGETALWFCSIYDTKRFVHQGIDSFLEASDRLEDFYQKESDRSKRDWDLGNHFEDFTQVLKTSDLLGCRYNFFDKLFLDNLS
jgi:hypothetical protein